MNGYWLESIHPIEAASALAVADPLEPSTVAALSPLEGAVALALASVVLGSAVLGFLPDHGNLVVDTGDRSPLISVCIGIPGVAALGSLLYLGLVLSTSEVGIFFAVPVVTATLTVLVGWTAAGFVTLAGHLLGWIGVEALWVRVLVAGLVGATLALSVPVGLLAYGLGATLGVGSGVRVLFNGGPPSQPEKRSIPPANRI